MSGYEVVEGTYEHALDLRDRLRDLDRRECMGQGMSLRRMMRRTFQSSLFTQAALSEGKCIAMWGMCGELVGVEGIPWLLTAPEVERFPVAILREAKKAVAAMLDARPYLANYVLSDYKQAVKLVSLIGFSVDQPLWTSPAGDVYRRFWMKRE